MDEVRKRLSKDHESRVGDIFLAVFVINCKLVIRKATKKIAALIRQLDEMDCPLAVTDKSMLEYTEDFKSWCFPAGPDGRGASTFWIQPTEVEHDLECHVQSALWHYCALHSDPISLRQGITVVLDLSHQQRMKKCQDGKRLQKLYHSLPQRPQEIYVLGQQPNAFTRVIGNTTYLLFRQSKLLNRLRFVNHLDEDVLSSESLPKYMGGNVKHSIGSDLVNQRLQHFPRPERPSIAAVTVFV